MTFNNNLPVKSSFNIVKVLEPDTYKYMLSVLFKIYSQATYLISDGLVYAISSGID